MWSVKDVQELHEARRMGFSQGYAVVDENDFVKVFTHTSGTKPCIYKSRSLAVLQAEALNVQDGAKGGTLVMA